MMRLVGIFIVCLLAGVGFVQRTDAVNVLTYHNDNTRLGVNSNETALTLANVNTNTFGRLFTQAVDGFVYAQPLVLTGVTITGKGVHDVVFIATEHDSVYAFDADSNAGPNALPLWQVSFIDPDAGVTTVPSDDFDCDDLIPEIGITSTPVIDPVAGTLYVVAKTQEVSDGVTNFVQRLHALDVGSGAEKFGGPVVIAASLPGRGTGSDGSYVAFDPFQELNRMGLLLNNGIVYFGFSSHCGEGAHGWVFAYDAQTLTFSNAFLSTPNGQLGGIWEAGCAPASDASNNVYFSTGNGDFGGLTNNDFGDSLLKFTTTNGFHLADFFTPYNEEEMFTNDQDLASGGVVLLPDAAGSVAHPHLMIATGKEGTVYLVDRDNLGQFNPTNDSQIVQEFSNDDNGSFGSPAYFNNTLYYICAHDLVKAFSISNAVINPTPVSQSPLSYGWPGGTPCITANGANDVIVWAIQTDAYSTNGPAILHAYDAGNVATELYNSTQVKQDYPGAAVKFTVPAIANGKVYLGAQYALSVFGLIPSLPPPAVTPNGGLFTNAVTVSITDTVAAAAIYYTLDGSGPTTNSTLYTAPFVISNNTTVLAIATLGGGTTGSVVSAASFTILTAYQAWQIQYFGSTNAALAAMNVDADGTGQDNLYKFVAGLDPTNPAAVFLLTAQAVAGQPKQISLTFSPVASGRAYTPWSTTNLVNGSWSPLTTYTGPLTNGNQVTITDTNAIQTRKFYRLNLAFP